MPAPEDRHIFVAYPWALHEDRTSYKRAYTGMERALNVKFVFAEERVSTGTVLEKIIAMIESAAFGIYDVSSWNANVTLEYGVARGLGAEAYIAFNPSLTDLGDVPSDVRGYDRLQYSDLDDLSASVESLVVQVLGTGAARQADPLEDDRLRLVEVIRHNPGRTARQLAELTSFKIDYVQLLLRRSAGELTTTGATRATKYTART
ncbi:MAG: hypothetical protein ACYCYA_05815 [Actinomycetes bacterium]